MADRLPPILHPVTHVLGTLQEASKAGYKLTTAAWLLAVVLAHSSRRTIQGGYCCWRGRDSLATLSGLSKRSISEGRAQLADAGIFQFDFASEGDVVIAADRPAKPYQVAKGILVASVVTLPEAYREHRDKQRQAAGAPTARQARRTIDKARKQAAQRELTQAVHPLRVELGNKVLRGELSEEEYKRRIGEAHQAARSARTQVHRLHPTTVAK